MVELISRPPFVSFSAKMVTPDRFRALSHKVAKRLFLNMGKHKTQPRNKTGKEGENNLTSIELRGVSVFRMA